MQLTKFQKEIVKKIAVGEITDILSYMKSFDLGKYFELDETDIKKRCHEKYKGRFFKVKRDNISRDVWSNLEDYDQEYYKANIRVRDSRETSYHYVYRDSSAAFSVYEKRYIAKNFSDIISFISLWQYLKSKALIIELPRLLVKEDFSLCTDVVAPYCYKYGDDNERGLGGGNHCEKIEQLEDGAVIKVWNSRRDYEEFIDWNFSFNEEKMELAYEYLSKKIYPAPELGNYIQNKFVTEDEKVQRTNFKIALAGVIIAIVTSLISLLGNFVPSDLKSIEEELEGIRYEISELDSE